MTRDAAWYRERYQRRIIAGLCTACSASSPAQLFRGGRCRKHYEDERRRQRQDARGRAQRRLRHYLASAYRYLTAPLACENCGATAPSTEELCLLCGDLLGPTVQLPWNNEAPSANQAFPLCRPFPRALK